MKNYKIKIYINKILKSRYKKLEILKLKTIVIEMIMTEKPLNQTQRINKWKYSFEKFYRM